MVDDTAKPPLRTGAAAFIAFVLAGTMPLIPYALAVDAVFPAAVDVTATSFFVAGRAGAW